MTVVTLYFTPIERFDGRPWTQVRIQEAPADTGPWTLIDTQTLTPVDSDPKSPVPRSFTTALATLDDGWYRVVWVDALSGTSPPTDPIHNVSTLLIRPTVAEVAILLRTRTVGESSNGLGGDTSPGDLTTFTSSTRPTAVEVEEIIDQAVEAVTGQLPLGIPATYMAQTRHSVALYAAIVTATSFFEQSIDEGSVEVYRDLLRTNIAQLRTDLEEDPAVSAASGFANVQVRSPTMSALYLVYPDWPEVP